MKTLTIVGRRWFQKLNGNTYHTVEIIVDGAMVHKTERAYGYGNQYAWTAAEWLEANGYMPDRKRSESGSAEGLGGYCQRNGIAFTDTVTDVTRKRDL